MFLSDQPPATVKNYDIVLVPKRQCVSAKPGDIVPELLETLKKL